MARIDRRCGGTAPSIFAPLRSLYFDGDLQLFNEAQQYDWLAEFFGVTPQDKPLPNPFAIGSALLWLPFYTLADLFCWLQPQCNRDGYSAPYVQAIFVGTAFWTSIGLALNVATLRRLLVTSTIGVAELTVGALALASPLVFYLLLRPDYAHANSYFAVALLLFLTVAWTARRPLSPGRVLACGLATGLVFLVRWQDIIVGLLPFVLLLWPKERPARWGALRGLIGRWMLFGVGILLVASLQLLAWRATFGTFLTLPQGEGFLAFAHVQVVEFFFSTWNGLLLWHPIILMALLGFFVARSSFFSAWAEQATQLRVVLLVVIGVEILVSMTVADWWAGGAFGQRRLVSILPLLSVGLCHLIWVALQSRRIVRTSVVGLICLLVLWNGLTMLRFRQGSLPFNPADPAWYRSGRPYDPFDYARRFQDILLGANHDLPDGAFLLNRSQFADESQDPNPAHGPFWLGLIVGCTFVQWLILAAQIPLLTRLPDWFWPLRRTPLSAQWLLLIVAVLAILIVAAVLRQPARTWLNLTLLVALGVAFQFGFSLSEGRGLDGLRDRIVTTGHAEFARVAVEQRSMGDVLVNYEALAQSGELGAYARSKPPGQLLLYMLSERLAYGVQPHEDPDLRLAWFQTVATFLWPILSYLVLVPLYFLATALLGATGSHATSAWHVTLLYLFAPPVALMALQADQVFFPLIFTLCLLAGFHATRADRIWMLLLAGALGYLALFVSFGLVVIAPFLIGFAFYFGHAAGSRDARRIARQLLLMAAGALLFDLLLRLLAGYDLFVRYRAAVAFHQSWKGWDNNLLDVAYYAGLNLIEYAFWIGAPLTILAALAWWRAAEQVQFLPWRLIVSQALILAAVICALAIFGRTKAEVARLWLFLLPYVCLVAAYELGARFAVRTNHVLYLVLLLQIGTTYLLKLNQDFW
ncbi:MAG: hypothetical protein HC802_07580 [Caldilineaceae bacterium]|nr:hypothetical protein [Caldilineaceae bacterium]